MADKQKKPDTILKLGLFLGVLGALSAALLAGVALMTKKPIEKAQLQKTNLALKSVLPAFDNIPADDKVVIEAENGTSVTFFLAKKDGNLVGVAGEGYTMKGFAGKVTVMVGMDTTGKIKVVTVTQQGETPGLGTVVTNRKREKTISDLFSSEKSPEGLPPNRILDGFDGHTVNPDAKPWAVKKDGGQFDFITGATITSRAVTDAVYTVDSTFVKNRDKIIPVEDVQHQTEKK